jgi:hypothetical protein
MSYHPCPVCGLRFERTTELYDHVSHDHTQHVSLEDEEQETIEVPKRSGKSPGSSGVVHLPW